MVHRNRVATLPGNQTREASQPFVSDRYKVIFFAANFDISGNYACRDCVISRKMSKRCHQPLLPFYWRLDWPENIGYCEREPFFPQMLFQCHSEFSYIRSMRHFRRPRKSTVGTHELNEQLEVILFGSRWNSRDTRFADYFWAQVANLLSFRAS